MEKIRYPRSSALIVARELCQALKPVTSRLIVAGSLRRMRAEVGDVEILYIPRMETRKHDFFASREVNLAEEVIAALLKDGTISKRLSKTGLPTWGDQNKLARHCSGMPIDLFAATPENWYNYLVCRTGPAESNTRIAQEAIRRGWKWNPYGPGFSSQEKGIFACDSERAVFEFVGLPYLPPKDRQ